MVAFPALFLKKRPFPPRSLCMAQFTRKLAYLSSAILIALGSACVDDPAVPTSMIGTYKLTQMLVTVPPNTPTNLIPVGATGTLTLAAGAAASGTLVIPTTATTGPGGTLSLTGDWAVRDGALTVTTAT